MLRGITKETPPLPPQYIGEVAGIKTGKNKFLSSLIGNIAIIDQKATRKIFSLSGFKNFFFQNQNPFPRRGIFLRRSLTKVKKFDIFFIEK